MGLFGSRRGRNDRVGLGGYPPGMVVMPEVEVAPEEVEIGNMPAAQRCPRDSDWCDGEICKKHGIDCPRAGRPAM